MKNKAEQQESMLKIAFKAWARTNRKDDAAILKQTWRDWQAAKAKDTTKVKNKAFKKDYESSHEIDAALKAVATARNELKQAFKFWDGVQCVDTVAALREAWRVWAEAEQHLTKAGRKFWKEVRNGPSQVIRYAPA